MTKGNEDKSKEDMQHKTEPRRIAHTALVLQGGGALAAYEAGVYGALYFWIKKDLARQDRNIFDVIAGTSGGAINGAIIVSHVLKKRRQKASISNSWKGSVRQLFNFWDHVSSSPDIAKWGPYSIFPELVADMSPTTSMFPYSSQYYRFQWPLTESSWMSRWNKANSTDRSIATGEAARRYYSAKEYLYSGAPNVFTRLNPMHDDRFFDEFFPPANIWYQYSNKPLLDSIKQHASFPIATTFHGLHEEDKRQPRLLLVSAEVQKGAIITFDSYPKQPNINIRRSEYQEFTKYEEATGPSFPDSEKIVIAYNDGIISEHVMASSSVPIHYDYADVPKDYSDRGKGSEKFWDGGILSNTPLRELIQAHENYWNDANANQEDPIPDLRVYIADIWPNEVLNLPMDHDAVVDRRTNLTYQDKTLHEEKVAYLIRDYIDLANELIKRGKIPDAELQDLLNDEGASAHRNGQKRTYGDLLKKKVRITGVTRIQRKPDINEISYKWCDYSSHTISLLIEQGFRETAENLLQEMKDEKESLKHRRDALDRFRLEIETEREDPSMAEDERLTDKQEEILKKTISNLDAALK